MSIVTSEKPQSTIAVGYTVATVIARIAALDIDASGNAEKSAWKRYLSLALLSLAKAWDKKKVAELVFGKGEKVSKSFQNMWSLADKSRATMIGNGNWADIKVMAIDDAQNEVLRMINAHMTMLSCTSKNEYDRYCNLSPMEADDKRKAEAAEKAEVKEAAEVAAKPDVPAEVAAQEAATDLPDVDLVTATLASLETATDTELQAIMVALALRLATDELAGFTAELSAIVANKRIAETAAIILPVATPVKGKKAA